MKCELITESIGPYLDGEATAEVGLAIEEHVRTCTGCADDLASFRRLQALFTDPETVTVPSKLWESIESDLEKDSDGGRRQFLPSRRFIGIAAALLFTIGVGLYSNPWGQRVEAATVDFGALLDGLEFDPSAAFERFLAQYQGQRTSIAEAKRYGRGLSFELPEVLPGDFRIEAAYALRFNDQPGVAARYVRDGEFLGVIFHPPVLRENFGTHADRECIVGKHRGHTVEIGEWSLVHLTGPTTCHCVLSKLDEQTDLPRILAAVAPKASATRGHHDNP